MVLSHKHAYRASDSTVAPKVVREIDLSEAMAKLWASFEAKRRTEQILDTTSDKAGEKKWITKSTKPPTKLFTRGIWWNPHADDRIVD